MHPFSSYPCKFYLFLYAVFSFFHHPLAAEEDQNQKPEEVTGASTPLANLEGEPSAYVNGHVNVITGDFSDYQVDLVVPGVEPLTVERSFSGSTEGQGSLVAGWNLSLYETLNTRRHKKDGVHYFSAYLTEGHGGTTVYEKAIKKKTKNIQAVPLSPQVYAKGMTNTSAGYISGQTNMKNTTISRLKQGIFHVVNGAKNLKEYKKPSVVSSALCITKAIKPNGNSLHYRYYKPKDKDTSQGCNHRDKIEQVEVKSKDQQRLAVVKCPKLKNKEFKEFPHQDVVAEDGRRVCYHFTRGDKHDEPEDYLLTRVDRSNAPTEFYRYMYDKKDKTWRVRQKDKPDGRFLKVAYYKKGDNKVGDDRIEITTQKDPRCGRVKALRAPIGEGAAPVDMYRFYYEFKNKASGSGTTTVLNALGHKCVYTYRKDHRLNYIDKYASDGSLYSREKLFWGKYDSEECFHLLGRSLVSESGLALFGRSYMYDDRGNVAIDSFHGNLSGTFATPLYTTKESALIPGQCETYQKYSHYSNDGYNLLTLETDGIQETSYEYEPESNRLSAKFVGAPNQIFLREFYEYNAQAAITKKIVDDGSSRNKHDLTGVTERHITYTKPRNAYPFGYPDEIIEKCLDIGTGQEILKNRVVNTYNNQGLLTSQMHFDQTDTYVHTLYWHYDEMGNLIKEVDPMQRVATWRYDGNGNCIYEQGFNPDVHKERIYDLANRLVQEDEVHLDGSRASTKYRYHLLSKPVAIMDHNGHETLFEYDAFERVIKITHSPVQDQEGELCSPSIHKTYDPMGNVTKIVDARGQETKMSYTSRGQVIKKEYPDGSSERNVYHLNGSLKCAYAKNGSCMSFVYDALGRMLQKTQTSTTGEILSSTSFTYSGFHVLTETDAMGLVTTYTYFPNGQLKSKQCGDLLISYVYDSLGRVKACHEHGADTLVKIYEYDLLNRVIEERTEDVFGNLYTKINKSYDQAGRVCEIRCGDKVISSILYDSYGTPIEACDGESNKTYTRCVWDYVNPIGQLVAYKETEDPLGNSACVLYDSLGRSVRIQKKNRAKEVTQQQEIFYDLNGNRCRVVDTIFSDKEPTVVTTRWEYDCLNRPICLWQAAGTPEEKCTRIEYNAFGQKERIIKADGVALIHTYDAAGRLASLQSSDNSIHYVYTYDLCHRPKLVEDLVHHTTSTKQYDLQGRMTKEVLANGCSLKYSYDALSRPKQITFDDGSAAAFSYRGNFLAKVQRLSQGGSVLYEHVYRDYDLCGRLTSCELIGNAAELSYSYDGNGRLLNISSSSWQEDIAYDAVGNIVERRLVDSLGSAVMNYRLDDLYQVVQESGDAEHHYKYDSHYNRLEKDGKPQTHNVLNQTLADGDAAYVYDANGNMIRKQTAERTFEFAYDALDRLVSVTKGLEQTRYSYDDTNRRLSKTKYQLEEGAWVLSDTTKYVYQGQNEIAAVNTQGQMIQLRLLGSGKGAEIGAAIALEIDGKVYAPIHDHSGHVACLIDLETKTIVESYRYSAFGEELFDQAISPWRFSSKRQDEETGFVYFGRRYYDPSAGRWISQDPIGRDGGPNLYAYVLNTPLTCFDLYGLSAESGQQSAGFSFSGFIGDVARLPGKIIQEAAFHLIPFRGIKDVVGCAGWMLQGRDPRDFTPSWNYAKSQVYHHEGYGNAFPNIRYVFYNGICTSWKEFKEHCAQYSQECGGADVYGVYNGTNGFVGDLLEVCCQKLSIPTEAQIGAERCTQQIIDDMGEYASDAILYTKAHSQGCETVYNLSEGLRKKMVVDAYGPARILHEKDFKYARNFTNAYDFVPMIADPVGLIIGCRNSNVEFVKSTGCPLLTHFLQGPTYQGEAIIQGNWFKRIYGNVR